jgi:predicted protein tyrosine phosphatase
MATKTEEIFQLSAPYDNPYQGTDKRLLFVCSAGLLRSATAANLFAKKGFNTRSCGSAEYALIPLSANLIAWADKIIFVNEANYRESWKKFDIAEEDDEIYFQHPFDGKDIQVLKIPDNYEYNNPDLIKFLEEQVVVPD